jgi:AAA ATPase domain
MSVAMELQEAEDLIRQRFKAAGISVLDLVIRTYPGETIFVVTVEPDFLPIGANLGVELDGELRAGGLTGFVSVRPAEERTKGAPTGAVKLGVKDPRATEFVRLVTSRSRTSEIQPSLSYVRDTAANISTATTPRHHLIFGRRGAGKTALMLETKRIVEQSGSLTLWMNIQTYRHEDPIRVFLWWITSCCEAIQSYYAGRASSPQVVVDATELLDAANQLLSMSQPDPGDVQRIVPRVQRMLNRFLSGIGRSMFIFLDDFHYLPRSTQPQVLDLLHGAVRDNDAWLKVAAIRHLARWFQSNPPLGLESGHDADHIDLDVTLQDPSRAKAFLLEMLQRYTAHANVGSLLSLFAPEALDRLVLASGAVPRDFLILSAESVRKAQAREKARQVGVQDVNKAAGDAAQVKINELEDDLASNVDEAVRTVSGLSTIRRFCLDEKKSTYFRVDFKDKEQHTDYYGVLASLLDLRLVHLVNPSLSDEKRAGERSEVFMLDLSQYSGQRLKRFIRVLDLVQGQLAMRDTGRKDSTRVGNTPHALLSILRRGPLFELDAFAPVELGTA